MSDFGAQQFQSFEQLAMSVAQRMVKRHDSFNAFPADDGQGGTIIGWLRRLGSKGISQRAATTMLNEDLTEAMLSLRARVWETGHERLGFARTAVLLYLALLPEIGAAKVLSWNVMWSALREERWDDAANALLLTEWPTTMRTPAQMARAVALQQVLRSGKQFNEDDETRISALGV